MILSIIGRGGMAAVYKAQDIKNGNVCAIKEMSLAIAQGEEKKLAIRNFLKEAKLIAGLHHSNLPAFMDFFEERSRYFLVMELIEGESLANLLKEHQAPFSEQEVLGWGRQLCDALTYLHQQHPPIIFRDMKPSNIMLRRDGKIKLIDFGIARFFRENGEADTQLLGTPGFAPPEQYGTSQTDARSDLYALSMALYQLLTNTLPKKDFGLKRVHETYPFISSTVAHALEKATATRPSDRYQSVNSFKRALLGMTEDQGSSAKREKEKKSDAGSPAFLIYHPSSSTKVNADTKFMHSKIKYGHPGQANNHGIHWHPLQITATQWYWHLRILAFVAASLCAGLGTILVPEVITGTYTLNGISAQLSLLLCIPLATSGCYFLQDDSQDMQDRINRLCTGLCTTICVATMLELLWTRVPGYHILLQLYITIFISAIAADIGMIPSISDIILQQAIKLIMAVRIIAIPLLLILGGGIGFMLSWAIGSSLLFIFSISLGVVCMSFLAIRAEQIITQL